MRSMMVWPRAVALVVLFPWCTCLPPRMNSEAIEIRTVARSPSARVTSMRLKPPSLRDGASCVIRLAARRCLMGGSAPSGRDHGVGAGHLARSVEIQGPAIGTRSADGPLQDDRGGSGADRAVGDESDGRRRG